MGIERTSKETVVDTWADDLGGVTITVRHEAIALSIEEARHHRDDLIEAIAAATRWAADNAAPAAESRN